MPFGVLLHGLGGILRRNRQRAARVKANGRRDGSTESPGDGSNSSPKPQIIHPSLEPVVTSSAGAEASDAVETITRAQMQESVDGQDASIFFAKLPLELRRQIYGEVWRSYLDSREVSPSATPGSDMRLHIYTDGSGRGTFRHTQCKVHTGAPGQDDAQVIEPWPFNIENLHTPPMWFWFAWIMRLHWDRHWICQQAVMKRWCAWTGVVKQSKPSPFLPVFLTCKKMYWEAISSLFETVTPVFTSSEDVHRFFLQRPHPFLDSIRSLELCFTNPNDHLFLAQVQRDVRTEVAPSAPAGSFHTCMVMPCRLEVFGQRLWSDLIGGVQTAVPGLRDLEITIGGRMLQDDALSRFGRRRVQDESDDAEPAEPESQKDLWTLPGKLTVSFKTDGDRYVQQGANLIRQ